MKSVRTLFEIALVAAVVSLATYFIATQLRKDPAQKIAENTIRDYLAHHPEDVQLIVKNYLIKNPEVTQEIIDAMIANGPVAAIKRNANLLFSSPRQVTLGNPKGDVTMVEFFDYNCCYGER